MFQQADLSSNTNITVRQLLHEFTESQKRVWPLAATNFNGLENVRVKHFHFDGFQIKVQFNPERLKSSVSKVDQQSIAARACFLCEENRPPEQEAIDFDGQYQILINPYPIFQDHFTIASRIHTPQRFFPNAATMLRLAKAFEGFMVFYNGPECGASAPDHLHFQAGEKELLPLDDEFEKLIRHAGRQLFSGENTQVWAFDNYLRKMISVETVSTEEALSVILTFYKHFQAMQPEKVEPMMNVLCTFSGGKWLVHLFPRRAHRPSHFFETGEKQILISPGSVDFGGLFITPRLEDFEKITKEDVVDILEQVCVDPETFLELTKKIKFDLKNKI